MRKAIVYLVLLFSLLLAGCSKKVDCYVIDVKIDLSPLPGEIYDGATLQVKSKTQVFSVPLELIKNLGIAKKLILPADIYSLTVTFFSGTTQIYRCPVKEVITVRSGYMLPPVCTLLIDSDEKDLFPIIIAPTLLQTGEKIVLDGSLSKVNSFTSFNWTVSKKPINSDLQDNVGTNSRAEFNLNYPGSYEFILTIDDGVNREFSTHLVEVADKWLSLGEPIMDIVAVANNSLAVLHGIPSKLSIYNETGMQTVEINDTCLKITATKKSSVIAVLSATKMYIYNLANLEIIEQIDDLVTHGIIAVTDNNQVFSATKDYKLLCWTLGSEPTINNNINLIYDKLFSTGKRLFINSSYLTELLLDESGQVVVRKTIEGSREAVAVNDDWLATTSRKLYKLFPNSQIGLMYNLGYGSSFVKGVVQGDYGAFVTKDNNYSSYGFEVYNIMINKLTRAWQAPTFGQPSDTKILKMEFLEDNTLGVFYEPGPYATFSEAIIGFYKCEDSTF